MALTAAEQLLLELINRARLNPVAEAARLGVGLNDGLSAGQIGTQAQQVLAPDTALESAAAAHSSWMLAMDTFSHTGSGGSSAGDRMATAGYVFEGSWTWGENLAWSGSTGAVDAAEATLSHYAGLFESAGHRANTLNADFSEVGVAQVLGTYGRYNASMLTENFAASGDAVFITGVAFHDRDGDRFYDIGEGQSGVTISAGGAKIATGAAGGYALALDATGWADVALARDGTTIARLRLDMSEGNAKLDLVTEGKRLVMATSVSTELVDGLSAARLLGVADLDLTGLDSANRLWGNAGDNRLTGHAGNDYLWGLAGADRLDGGAGRDKIWGGAGADTFVFTQGRDRIMDFDDADSVLIDSDALEGSAQGARLSVAALLDTATVTGGNLVIALGAGDTLIFQGVTDAGALAGQIEFA